MVYFSYSIHMPRKYHSQFGTSFIELLAGLTLSLPILLLLGTALHTGTQQYLQAKERMLVNSGKRSLLQVVQQIAHDLDSHPFELAPRIHRNGSFTFVDGTILRHHSIGNTSHGITSVRLHIAATLQLQRTVNGACLLRAQEISGLADVKSMLFVGSSGIFEAPVRIQKTDTLCYALHYEAEQASMITKTARAKDLEFASLAVPIRWVQTVYRDNRGSLRVIRTIGSRILLNQPIAKQVPIFRLRTRPSVLPNFYEIGVRFQTGVPLWYQHHIPRIDYRDLLINLLNIK